MTPAKAMHLEFKTPAEAMHLDFMTPAKAMHLDFMTPAKAMHLDFMTPAKVVHLIWHNDIFSIGPCCYRPKEDTVSDSSQVFVIYHPNGRSARFTLRYIREP
ncbi:unnamed protein product [Toxocara canis]|uniref:SoxZ domain-containing protein n=1 Tax=Toxocara canis TaxID=6265 RepID=A0A183VCP7_TOXCA|nr:unnamed protein product [Toxocara canis]